MLAHNPQIQRVYLAYGYHSLSSSYDEATFGKNSKDVATRYFYILPSSVKQLLLLNNRKELLLTLRNIGINGIKNVVADNKPMLGRYENAFFKSAMVREAMVRRTQGQFYEQGKPVPFSEINLAYLQRIVKLCKAHHVDLVLLGTPVHPQYESRVPEAYKRKYQEVARGMHLIEFRDLPLSDSSFIQDGDHVSAQGAQLVTASLRKEDAAATSSKSRLLSERRNP